MTEPAHSDGHSATGEGHAGFAGPGGFFSPRRVRDVAVEAGKLMQVKG
jgi:hypothetical protein